MTGSSVLARTVVYGCIQNAWICVMVILFALSVALSSVECTADYEY